MRQSLKVCRALIKGHSQVGEPEPLSGGPIPRSWMFFLAQQSQGSAAVKKERKFCFALHQISRSRALDISRAHAPLYVGHTAIFVCELSSRRYTVHSITSLVVFITCHNLVVFQAIYLIQGTKDQPLSQATPFATESRACAHASLSRMGAVI